MAYNSIYTGDEIDIAVSLSKGPWLNFYFENTTIPIPTINTWQDLEIPGAIVSEAAEFTNPVGPGLQYTGAHEKMVLLGGFSSFGSNVNNTTVELQIVKNMIAVPGSRVMRYLSTGPDVGVWAYGTLFRLQPNDIVGVQIRGDKVQNIEVETNAMQMTPIASFPTP